ncbi:hypothetical protein Ciccas_005265 [Cichlidogyrus casuarinus]|uniref:Uncharacterized protein n=1 Tax=Cichlidogyrus casuarinus TaxID=1844966 RepID=A0ABD2Q952_9PLAT
MDKEEPEFVTAKFDYTAADSNELTIKTNERLRLLDDSKSWWAVQNASGKQGFVPSNFVERVKSQSGWFSSLKTPWKRSKSKSSGSRENKSPNSRTNGTYPPNASNGSINLNGGSVTAMHNQTDLYLSDKMKSLDTNVKTPANMNGSLGPASNTMDGRVGSRGPADVHMSNYSASTLPQMSTENPPDTAIASSSGLCYCQANYAYCAEKSDELSIKRGDRIQVQEKSSDGWWRGYLLDTKTSQPTAAGWFPSNYVVTIDPTLISSLNGVRPGVAGSNISLANNQQDNTKKAMGSHPGVANRSQSVMAKMPPGSVAQPGSTVPMNGSFRPPLDQNGTPADYYQQFPRPGFNYVSNGSQRIVRLGSSNNNNGSLQRPFPMPASPPVIRERVLTLYPFRKNQEEEMSFDPQEVLDVVDKPVDDPDWWRCRNIRGEEGLVPRNYVRVLDSVPVAQESLTGEELRLKYARMSRKSSTDPFFTTMVTRPWYWGAISRNDCEHILSLYAKIGEFIVRDSESHPGDLTVTMMAGNKNRNFKVNVQAGLYHIGQKTFRSLDDLISHYQLHPIFKNEEEKHYLTQPFSYPRARFTEPA